MLLLCFKLRLKTVTLFCFTDDQWANLKTLIEAAGGDVANEAGVREGLEIAVQKGLNVTTLEAQYENRLRLTEAAMASADSLSAVLGDIQNDNRLCGYLLGVDSAQTGPNVWEFGEEQEKESRRRLELLYDLLQTISARARANPGGTGPLRQKGRGRKTDLTAIVMCRVFLNMISQLCPFPFRDQHRQTSRALVSVFEAVLAAGYPNNRDNDRLAAQRILRRELSRFEQMRKQLPLNRDKKEASGP
jgi:hypothetical protein